IQLNPNYADAKRGRDEVRAALAAKQSPETRFTFAFNDFYLCKEGGNDAIAPCGRAIASGKYKGGDLATLYYGRGHAYRDRGDYDRAIADYSRAIDLEPKDERAIVARGKIYKTKGDNVRALNDFEAVLRINPDHTDARSSRDEIRSALAPRPAPYS